MKLFYCDFWFSENGSGLFNGLWCFHTTKRHSIGRWNKGAGSIHQQTPHPENEWRATAYRLVNLLVRLCHLGSHYHCNGCGIRPSSNRVRAWQSKRFRGPCRKKNSLWRLQDCLDWKRLTFCQYSSRASQIPQTPEQRKLKQCLWPGTRSRTQALQKLWSHALLMMLMGSNETINDGQPEQTFGIWGSLACNCARRPQLSNFPKIIRIIDGTNSLKKLKSTYWYHLKSSPMTLQKQCDGHVTCRSGRLKLANNETKVNPYKTFIPHVHWFSISWLDWLTYPNSTLIKSCFHGWLQTSGLP